MPNHEARYFSELSDRMASGAEQVPFKRMLLDECLPEPAQCHYNAARVAEEFSGYSVVPGWLIDTIASRLIAHSVVEDSEGRLFEVTAPHTCRFVRHRGTMEQFEEMKEKYPAIFYRG